MMSARGQRVRLALVSGALVEGVLPSCGTTSTAADDLPGATRVDADYHADEYGVRVGIRVGFPEAREVVGARLVTADAAVEASLYPLDGTDPDRPPESVRLAPGAEVSLEGTLLLACQGERDLPVFEVVSLADGATRTDRYVPADTEGYQQAVDDWCDRSVTMSVTGSRVTAEGAYELHVEFSNPGPDAVTVTSAQIDDGSTSWEEASVVVPSGSIGRLTIHGQGPPECAATPPWETGQVRVDGRPIKPAGSDGWC